MTDELLTDIRNGVARITLNRPQALNSLTLNIVRELSERLAAWQDDDSIQAVLARGAGEKAFCAGGDVRAIQGYFKEGKPEHLDFFAEEYRLDYLIHRYEKPYVALMNGIVMGGGMGIAQGAALRIATDRTRMAMPETTIGLFPDVGASYFLSRLPGALGIYLGVSGRELRAADILAAGLADVYIETDALSRFEGELEQIQWSSNPMLDVESIARKLARTPPPPPELAVLRDAIDLHFSELTIADIVASLTSEQRAPYADWAKQTLEAMARRSPTMLSVTLAQLHRAKRMSLADCFRMELGMVHECFQQGDFMEGVRALLIDKDNSPRWNPPTLEAVASEQVERFFAARWPREGHPLKDLK
jgi:enoyl-CoA hydratase/carnithine racemase